MSTIKDNKTPINADEMIFKVQISLTSSDKKMHMLVYDKIKNYMYQAPVTPDVKQVMGNRIKAYFYGTIVNSKIQLGEEAPAQDW